MRNVINIVNFIRGCDPRADFDLRHPVREQIRLAEEYHMPMTFLYQYDALIQPEFIDLLKGKEGFELGIWLENSIWLVEKAGLVWRGRAGYNWDWHACVDMTVGYTTDERKLLIDEIMRKFKEVFGYYPKTVGSWALDAYSVGYMKEQYHIEAVLICKEQWGTDGYSLWGGYYSGAYFPCKNNLLSPAQSTEEQIDVPVFRMLGSDPIDQYMSGIGTAMQKVETMEPAYYSSGADEPWVRWYLDEMFGDKNLGLNYCQAGQENSFKWEDVKDGYIMQMRLFDEKRKNGEIEFELVSETGEKFRDAYKTTPVTTVDAHKEDSGTLWFNSRYYRGNLYFSHGTVMVRDIFIFNEKYRERYFDRVAEGTKLYFDNLPLIDCFRWSTDTLLGGAYFKHGEKAVTALDDFRTKIIDNKTVVAEIHTEIGEIQVLFGEKTITFEFPEKGCSMEAVSYKDQPAVKEFRKEELLCNYEGFDYRVKVIDADCQVNDHGYKIIPHYKSFVLSF